MRYNWQLYLTIVSVCVLSIVSPHVSGAQVWHTNIAGSTVDLSGSSHADDMNSLNGGAVSTSDSRITFISDLATPSGNVDWGAELNISASDGGVMSSAGRNFVTIDGDGSELLTIRWRVDGALTAEGATNFDAHVDSRLQAMIVAEFDMAPGERFRLHHVSDRTATATSIHEATLEDKISATDSFVYKYDFPPGNPSFSTSVGTSFGVDADPRLAPPFFPSSTRSTSRGSVVIISMGGEPFKLTVNINDRVLGDLKSPGPSPSNGDFASAFVEGEITYRMELVPEPATGILALLVVPAGLLYRRDT